MANPSTPFKPGPGQKLKPSRRSYRLSDEHSPTRNRIHDELLSQLTPLSAVDVLQHPDPSLKACLDSSTANEQEYAMRTALASQQIYEWLDELLEWPWPAYGGSAGFERPIAKRRKLFEHGVDDTNDVDGNEGWLGSLPEEDVDRYEDRVEEITLALNELEMDEIKTHILHNHIIPLSRPGTPGVDANPSLFFSAKYARLDDLAAVITAIVLQALPNLSKLGRLLNAWRIRLSVLRGIPSVLAAISEAEVALQSGWNVVAEPAKRSPPLERGSNPRRITLTEQDFGVMKLVLQKKIASPGRMLDRMLDSLEGSLDVLPEEWLDRMDAVENGYAAWYVACQNTIRQVELAKGSRPKKTATSVPINPEILDERANDAEVTFSKATAQPSGTASAVPVSVEPPRDGDEISDPSSDEALDARCCVPSSTAASGSRSDIPALRTPIPFPGRDCSSHDGSDDVDPVKSDLQTPASDVEYDPFSQARFSHSVEDEATVRLSDAYAAQLDCSGHHSPDAGLDHNSQSALEHMDDEPELPPLISRSRRSSNASDASVVVYNQSDIPSDHSTSSDMPEVSASPPLPRQKTTTRAEEFPEALLPSPVLESIEDTNAESLSERARGNGESQIDPSPSSSTVLTQGIREDSEDPMMDVTRDGDDSLLRSPFEPTSFLEEDPTEDMSSIMESPSKAPEGSSDDQLRRQIHNILESIPANIKLTNDPNRLNVNLNPPPPDLPTQRPKKPVKEPFRRSASGLSSRTSTRASTPSFLLAPAYGKNPRPRRQQGQQETKVYHLSRTTGEAPIKLLIRCVGEHGERVMVRVGGGWADLGEYLKEYAAHHGRRSNNPETAKIEVRDLPRVAGTSRAATASPPIRPASALDSSPITPLNVRKTRKSFGASGSSHPLNNSNKKGHAQGAQGLSSSTSSRPPMPLPKTPATQHEALDPEDASKVEETTPSSDTSTRSRSSSHVSWGEEDSSLGLAGPTGRKLQMSEENKAWVESVKEKVRLASGERKPSSHTAAAVTPVPTAPTTAEDGRFGEMGRVGGTKRLFRKG